MTALETRLDLILPTLATKADVESLRLMSKADVDSLRVANKAEFDSLRAEIEKSALRADVKFAELRSDMHRMNAEIRSWTLATMVTIIGTMLAAILGISQVYKGTTLAASAPQAAPAAPAKQAPAPR